MKNIIDILTDNGIEVPEEKKEALNKGVAENYKTISEFNAKKEKADKSYTEAQKTIQDLKAEIDGLKSEDVQGLKDKIAQYEAKETQRLEAEKQAKELEDYKQRFTPLYGDNKFLNEGTEQWILNEFIKAVKDDANKSKSDTEVYAEIVKDKNIYLSPNQVFKQNSAGKQTKNASKDDDYLRTYYKGNPFYKE